MKWYYKALLLLLSLGLLLLLFNIGLNLWIDRQLPRLINRENDSPYQISYQDLDFSVWDGRITAKKIKVVPKAAGNDKVSKAGIYATVESLQINDFHIWDIVFRDKIRARSIAIRHPDVVLYKQKARYDVKKAVVGPFDKIISVSDIYLEKGNFKIFSGPNKTPFLSASNINVKLEGVLVSQTSMAAVIPFHFRDYQFVCDSLHYEPNPFYDIKTHTIRMTKSGVAISQLAMLPKYSREAFVSKIPKEKDLYTLVCHDIRLEKLDWGFRKKDLYVYAHTLRLDQARANIYRAKVPPDDLSKKPLYNKLLRELPFDLRLDTLKVRNSLIEYEEEKGEYGAGKLTFSQFNVLATHINSGFKKKQLPQLQIRVQCNFMKTAPLRADWRINVLDPEDSFRIRGTLTNFDAENMTRFTKPYMNVTVNGVMDEVHFDFKGNDLKSSGQLSVKYDDLKFTIYQKDNRQKKNKFLTFVAKIFVKKDTKSRLKEADVAIDRIPEKSFYNFLWRSVADGLKKILV